MATCRIAVGYALIACHTVVDSHGQDVQVHAGHPDLMTTAVG